MQELSLNVLDVAENSVAAGASIIEITVDIQPPKKSLLLTIRDNGKGMTPELLARVTDPFCTSRTTRKVGLGLPFLKMAAEMTGGGLDLQSTLGKGTCLRASFVLGHIDLAPLGDMSSTVSGLVQCNPELDFVYTVVADTDRFVLDTRQIKQMLDGISLAEPEIALWLRQYLNENTEHLLKRSCAI